MKHPEFVELSKRLRRAINASPPSKDAKRYGLLRSLQIRLEGWKGADHCAMCRELMTEIEAAV